MIKILLKKKKASVRDFLGQYAGMIPLLAYRSSWDHAQVRKDSVICIEGYPRSANTYSVAAFNISNPDKGHVARHSHLAGQVIRAIRFGIPTVILIRKPEDAILSMKIREPNLDYDHLLKSYVRFYSVLLPFKSACCVGRFEEVTGNFSKVIDEVNVKFRSDFKATKLSDELVFEEVQSMFEDYQERMSLSENTKESRIAKPNEERERIKKSLSSDLHSSKYESLLEQAEVVYQDFIN